MSNQVLVVDDSNITRSVLKRAIQEAGYQIVEASSGEQALDLIKANEFDLITLDIDMPGLTGYDTCKEIRRMERRRKASSTLEMLPIIFVTADDTLEGRILGFEAGASDFVIKSECTTQIVGAINRYLRPSNEFAYTRVLVADDSRLIGKMIKQIVESLGAQATITTSGAMAREMIDSQGNKLDLIILGRTLEGISGIELLRYIRSNPNFNDIPVGITTASGDTRDCVEVFRAGGNGFLEKPFLREEITSWVSTALKGRLHARQRNFIHATLSNQNRQLREFAFVSAYELKSSLKEIRSSMQVIGELLTKYPDSQAERILVSALHSGESLDAVVSQLVEYSQLSLENVQKQEVKLDPLVKKIVFERTVETQNCSAEILIRSPLPSVLGDELLLYHMLHNIIGNALKFRCPQRPLQIEIKALESALRIKDVLTPAWELAISDNGIGFESNENAHIFGLFSRAPSSAAEYDGHGIGLALSAKLAEALGGVLNASSEPGESATFSITLPKVERQNILE